MADVPLPKAVENLFANLDFLLKNKNGRAQLEDLLNKLKLAKTFDDASAKLLKKDNILDSTPEKNDTSDNFSIWMM